MFWTLLLFPFPFDPPNILNIFTGFPEYPLQHLNRAGPAAVRGAVIVHCRQRLQNAVRPTSHAPNSPHILALS